MRSDTVREVWEAFVLKWSIFVVQRLALHQNGVEFRQQSIGDIRISQTMSSRRAMLLENWLITHQTIPSIEAARFLKMYSDRYALAQANQFISKLVYDKFFQRCKS